MTTPGTPVAAMPNSWQPPDLSTIRWSPERPSMSCGVNVNALIRGYDPAAWGDYAFITDLQSVRSPSDPDEGPDTLYAALAHLHRHRPGLPIGHYISGTRMRVPGEYGPPNRLDPRGDNASWCGDVVSGAPGDFWMRTGAGHTYSSWGRKVARQIIPYGGAFAFIDNIDDPVAGGHYSRPALLSLLQALSLELMRIDRRGVIINLAGAPTYLPVVAAAEYSQVVDGICVEQPWFYNSAKDPVPPIERYRNAIAVYQQWQRDDRLVIWCALGETDAERAAEAEKLCRRAVIRQFTNVFVSWPFWQHQPDFFRIAQNLGEPDGDVYVDDSGMVRKFAWGELSCEW